MKSADIVYTLRANLPQFNNYFTDQFTASDITESSNVVTVTSPSPLTISDGDFVNIIGAQTQFQITSLVKENRTVNELGFNVIRTIAVATTSTPHGLNVEFTPTVEISGANEALYNGEKTLFSVDSPTVFTYEIDDAAPTPATGTIIAVITDIGNLNGYKEVFNTTANTFDYNIDISVTPDTTILPMVRFGHRIVRAYPIERSIEEYTKQPDFDDMVIFVTINDGVISKSRQIDTDATQTQNQGTEARQRLIQSFSLYVFVNTTDQIDAAKARDEMEDLLPELTRSLLRTIFPSPFAETSWSATTFLGHGEFLYAKPYYIHNFNFETVFDITQCDTVIPYTPSVNLNEIDIDYKKLDDDNIIMTSKILLNNNEV